jgi:hypothetical protein
MASAMGPFPICATAPGCSRELGLRPARQVAAMPPPSVPCGAQMGEPALGTSGSVRSCSRGSCRPPGHQGMESGGRTCQCRLTRHIAAAQCIASRPGRDLSRASRQAYARERNGRPPTLFSRSIAIYAIQNIAYKTLSSSYAAHRGAANAVGFLSPPSAAVAERRRSTVRPYSTSGRNPAVNLL